MKSLKLVRIKNWSHFPPRNDRTNSNQLNFMQHVAGDKILALVQQNLLAKTGMAR